MPTISTSIREKIPIIRSICEDLGVESLYLFGSVLTDAFDRNKKSDLDILVDMPTHLSPLEKGEKLLSLWATLEALLNRPVDLVTTSSLSNPYLIAEIERTKVLVYDRKSEEIPV